MDVLNYILKRILQMIPVFFIVAILIFVLIRAIPGDPAMVMLGERATAESLAALREKLGLNESYLTQLILYFKGIFTLDLGDSIKFSMPVTDLILSRVGTTIWLTIMSTFFTIIFSFIPGYIAGIKKDKLPDSIIRVIALIGLSVPAFWIGLVLLTIFAVRLKILPVSGWGDTIADHFIGLILPSITQAIGVSAVLIRNLRSNVIDIKNSDYVDYAKSKGLSHLRISSFHIVRNALIPTTTLLSLKIIAMFGGSIVIENVFTLPGIGALLVTSIYARDYAVVQGIIIMFVVVVMVINLITDILYSILDPRVKLS
ncbi:MAG: ABC transporter permease [Clostridiales bacterium]|nr:ABC transporter permease [Clostridiales bacterium]